MKSHRLKVLFAATTAFLGVATPAAAVSMGDTVSCTSTGLACYGTNTIGTGVEYSYGLQPFPAFLTLDFSDSLLTVRSYGGTLGVGYTITLQDLTNPISGFQLLSTGSTAFTASNLSLTGNALTLNLANVSFTSGAQVQIGLSSGNTSAVPEAATWAMMIAGFGLTGATLRNRRRPSATLRAA